MWVKAALAAGALAATFAGGWGGGYRWRDRDAIAADLERERAASVARMHQIERSDEASQLTERRLAEARAIASAARVDAERVRELAGRVAASAEASERDRERIRVLAELVASGARVVEEGVGVVGRLDARLAGCQAAP